MQNKYDIRDNLYKEIGSILGKRKELEVLDLKITIYKELTDLLVKNSIEDVRGNSLMISLLLNTILDESSASRISEYLTININDILSKKRNP